MRYVIEAFEFSDDPNPLVKYAKVICQLIFDIKFDLIREVSLVLTVQSVKCQRR